MSNTIDGGAGSLNSNEPAFLVLGKLRRPHGVMGEITLDLYSNLPELLVVDKVVYIGENHQTYTLKAKRMKGEFFLLKLEGVDDRSSASELTNALLYTPTDQLPKLPDGDYYIHQLIGIDVFDSDEQYLGILAQILETGANDVYLVKDQQGKEVLIPAVEDFVIDVDLDARKMIVAKIEWYGEGD